MKTVALGIYGSTLDAGAAAKRWDRWRPTVSLCRHDDLVIDRLELLHDPAHTKGAELIADDIALVSPETKIVLHPIAQRDPWDFEEVFASLHEFARSYPFDLERERYLVHITTGTHVAQICFFLLTESRHIPASLVQTSPPTKKGELTPGPYRIIDLDLSRYDRLARRFELERAESLSFLKSGISTRNKAFNRLIENLERIALRTQEPILLTGPTGAGKSHLARQIYELKRSRKRITGPFVEINCATLRGDGAMSALFGHVKGAFTGAARDRDGLLRSAHRGILFLDEIGELGLDEQAMLLRAIEEKRFLPVGSDREVESDFELIAGTNRDLLEAVVAGRFREDLHARIRLWWFDLPGLAERREDIEPNLDYQLGRASERLASRITINTEARDRFLRFATSKRATWPGSFRDFNAAILRMATLAPGGRIDLPTVEEEITRLRKTWTATTRAATTEELVTELLGHARANDLDRFDRIQLEDTLQVCRQSTTLSQAGRTLFAISRQHKRSRNDTDRLRKYLARFNLTWDDIHPEE